MPKFKKVYTESYRSGFYHPISILILAAITLTVALAIFANSGFFANKNKPTPNSTHQASPKPAPEKSPAKSSPKTSPAGQPANPDLIGASWKTYTNTKYYYTFKFPEDLEYGGKPASDTDKLTITNGENDSYKFPEDKFVGFRVWVIFSEKSLEDYLNEEYPKNQAGIPAFETGLQNGKITKITIDNVSGFKASNGMQFENTERTAWVKKNNLIYKFTTFGNGETGSSYTPEAGKIFDQILSTFKFTN